MFFLADLEDTKKVCSRGWLVRLFLLRWLSLAWHRKRRRGGRRQKSSFSLRRMCDLLSPPRVMPYWDEGEERKKKRRLLYTRRQTKGEEVTFSTVGIVRRLKKIQNVFRENGGEEGSFSPLVFGGNKGRYRSPHPAIAFSFLTTILRA